MATGNAPPSLQRHFGLMQATALNITMVVGAGVFVTIPLMLAHLPGPLAMLGWAFAGILIFLDGMVWSELGAALPGSGGSYLYLLESYGRNSWGRLMAFLFVWQFLLSGPLEMASGLIALSQFAAAIHPDFAQWNEAHTWKMPIMAGSDFSCTFSPSRGLAFVLGLLLVILLYRRVEWLGKLTMTFWLGVVGAIGWILIEGLPRVDFNRAFDLKTTEWPGGMTFAQGLGQAMILAIYSYLGYYNICHVGDEVRDPGKNIPRSILLCTLAIITLFLLVHLALTGVVSWREIPVKSPEVDSYSLSAEFMRRLNGEWAAVVMTLFLVWSCFGAAFAGLLGYSRIPYGAAKQGHFFQSLAAVHPQLKIPHRSLLLVCMMTLFWSFFDLTWVITALITTRILEQFLGQIVGLFLLRARQPLLQRPYRIPLYPWPCLLAAAGWLFVYLSAGWFFILLGLGTMTAGCLVFLAWSAWCKEWPFASPPNSHVQEMPWGPH